MNDIPVSETPQSLINSEWAVNFCLKVKPKKYESIFEVKSHLL